MKRKVLCLAFLNLCLLAGVILVLARVQFRLDAGSILLSPVQNRIMTMAHTLAMELDETAPEGWNAVVARYSQTNRVSLYLLNEQGFWVAGEELSIPPEVADRIPQRRGGKGGGAGVRQRPLRRVPAPPLFLTVTGNPTRYWAGVRVPVRVDKAENPKPGTLVVMSPTLTGSPLFFDATPWLTVGAAVILVSLVCWLPFVRGLTRSLTLMTQAAGQIAEGRFDARVPDQRRDELGEMGTAINRLASRLSGFMSGQKRFLGGIAHELCNPLATIQFGLGNLERRVSGAERESVAEIQEEVQHMSDLVNELLSFSRAGIQGMDVKLEPVNVAATVARVLVRESFHAEVAVDERLNVMAEPEYLFRAISNVVRNAIRYAGSFGPITIGARALEGKVLIVVADQGPGVPSGEMEEVFAPFYRLDPARNQQTGGFGLGLAIVKACVGSCGGTVRCANRKPTGLEVEITLSDAANCKGSATVAETLEANVF